MLLSLLAAALLAQGPAVTVVRAARVLDVSSGRITANGSVVVENGRISAVNPASTPAGASVLDLGNVTRA